MQFCFYVSLLCVSLLLTASLKRMQLEYVDLVFAHRPDPLVEMSSLSLTMRFFLSFVEFRFIFFVLFCFVLLCFALFCLFVCLFLVFCCCFLRHFAFMLSGSH